MHSQDFLRTHAQTELSELFNAAGTVCQVSTNCETVLESARGNFMRMDAATVPVDLSLRFWVESSSREEPPWPQPYVRGLGHMVFAGFSAGSSMLADLRARRVTGRFSAAMAADSTYWRKVIFPILLSMVAGSVGIVELHAACVARNQHGLILAGPGRSGKSTLAMAVMKAGFRLLSDDRTFCSLQRGKCMAYGLPRPLKLRRDAASWFEEFRGREPMDVQNGERVFLCEPSRKFDQPAHSACEPRALVFLDRQLKSGFDMSSMAASEAKHRIETDLLAEAPAEMRRQEQNLNSLTELPCWHLRYCGTPQQVAEQLIQHFTASVLENA